jgi:hypothetical protein
VLLIDALHVPAFRGVTTSVNVDPLPDGVPKLTIAAAPVPHVGAAKVNEDGVTGTLDVMVTG